MSRRQAKRAAFAHRRREWRRIVAEFKAWPCPRHDDRVDFFQREFMLEDTLQADPRAREIAEKGRHCIVIQPRKHGESLATLLMRRRLP